MTTHPDPHARQRSRAILRQKLESLYRSGVQQIARPPQVAIPVAQAVAVVAESPPVQPPEPRPEPTRAAAAPARPASQPVRPAPAEPPRPQPAPAVPASAPLRTAAIAPVSPVAVPPALPSDQRVAALADLCSEVVLCRRCDELARQRTQTVFGVGHPHPRLCFLGEAPGADEDRQGEPFVGAAGQLLDKIIAACTLKREDVYILNVLKCRPPDNRTPLPDEVANCRPFFERQLEILQPEFICCLGAVAAQSLLRTTRPVGQLRGKFHTYRHSQVVVTYHPSYLLRTPEMKRHTWEDMKMLMQAMGIPIPAR